MKKRSKPSAAKRIALQPVDPIIVPDDRLGPDEPLDQANARKGEASRVAAQGEEAETQRHRVSKMEADDEHNNENLVEEGLQGYMHGSLTKPRKLK